MKNVLISLATVGLLLSSGAAFSQNTDRNQSGTPSTTQSQPAQTGQDSNTNRNSERRDTNRGERSGERSERRGDRDSARVRDRGERSSFNVRIRSGEGYRYRRHHREGFYVGGGGCRTIVIKKHYHGRTVIRRIHRCR
jgi:hypothetical protein